MENILVLSDFSQEADNAFAMASNIAKQIGGKICLLHVADFEREQQVVSKSMVKELMAEELIFTKRKARELELEYQLEKGQVQEIVRFGDIDEEIDDFLETHNPWLIVMGHREAEKRREVLEVSHAKQVLIEAQCPVLVVGAEGQTNSIDHILLATTGNEKGFEESLNRLRLLQKLFGAKLHLLRVNTKKGEHVNMRPLHVLAEDHQLENHTVNTITASTVSQGISDFTKQLDVDLVATLTHRHSFVERLFGTHTDNIVDHCHKPVIALKSMVSY